MNRDGGSDLQQLHGLSWLETRYQVVRRQATVPTLTALVGIMIVLILLLVPPLPWNMRLPLYLVVMVWTILRPRIALYLLAFAVPWGSLDFISAGGLRLNSADVLVGFLAAGWLMSWVLPAGMRGQGDDKSERAMFPVHLALATLALLGVMFLSMLVAINIKDSLKEIFKWLEFLVVILLGVQYLRTRRQIWTLVACIVIAAVTQAFFGYAQAIFNLGPEAFIRSSALRVYGTFDQPNPYAGYLDMALVVVIAIVLLAHDRVLRICAGIATCLIGIAFGLSQSRGGQVALGAALLFIFLTGLPRVRIWLRLFIVAVFLAFEGIAAGFIPLTLFDQVGHFLGLTGISLAQPSSQDFSTAERLAHWIAGISMYLSHPILGVGIGNYPDVYSHYYITIFTNSLGQAHNYYINIAAETGTIGLIVYLFFVASMLVAGGSAVRRLCTHYWSVRDHLPRSEKRVPFPPGTGKKFQLLVQPTRWSAYSRTSEPWQLFKKIADDRALSIGLLAALVTICVHNLVDDLYDHSLTSLMALLLIALIRLGAIAARE